MLARLVACCLLSLAVACGGSPKAPAGPDPVATARLTAVIDGVRWAAARPFWRQRLTLTEIGGSDTSRGSLFTLSIDGASVGIHQVTNGEDARVFATYFEAPVGGPIWMAGPVRMTSGTVSITRITDREITGTFEFVLQPVASMGLGAASGAKTITDGEFVVLR